MEFKFSKFSPIRSKALYLGIPKPTKPLDAQSIQNTLYLTGKVNRHLAKEMKKKTSV